jgi:Protein of unknown function (DUF4199)
MIDDPTRGEPLHEWLVEQAEVSVADLIDGVRRGDFGVAREAPLALCFVLEPHLPGAGALKLLGSIAATAQGRSLSYSSVRVRTGTQAQTAGGLERMEQQQAPTIFGIATKYGLIMGVLSLGISLAGTLGHIKPTWVLTVVSVALLIVLMVLAHRDFKKTHDGMMTYGQGLGSGTLLAAVSAAVNAVLLYIYASYINSGYIEVIKQTQQAALAQRGVTGAQAQQAMAMTSILLTPVGIAVSSLIGGVILGFIVALIVSIFTQKSDPRAVI